VGLPFSPQSGSPVIRYSLAIGGMLLMLSARFGLDPMLGDRIPYAMFLLAASWSAVVGGVGPALTSLALGMLAGTWFFVPPRQTFGIQGAENWIGLLVTSTLALIVTVTTETQRRARFRAEAESAARESERQRFEAELRELHGMIDASYDAILIADRERRITMWNTGAREIYGFTAEEARGQNLHSFLRTRGAASSEDSLLKHGHWYGELLQTRKDGGEIVCESRQIVLRDAEGVGRGILVINRDVTARRKAQARAEDGQRTLEALMEFIPEGIVIADAPDVRIRMISRYGIELSGRVPEELVGTTAAERAPRGVTYYPDGRTPVPPEAFPLTRAATKGELIMDEEYVVQRPDGTRVTLLINASPIRDEEGNVTGALIAYRDITERKRFEENLRETAKLESLGILAGGIAHDFNNLLTGVLGNAALLVGELPAGSPAADQARTVMEAAEQAAKLANQMLAYSGRGRFILELIDLSAAIRQTATLIASSIRKGVEMKLDLAPDLPLVEADPAQIQQLVMNLVINAAEAIDSAEGSVRVVTGVRGEQVQLEVADTGSGMDEATIARIFDPFFTTKFTGRGLGLAAAQGIVRGHKGTISVRSEPRRGTTFTVLLPASTSRRVEIPARPQHAGDARGVVLVVDDEAVVRITARRALERRGFSVLEAPNGAEAARLLREDPAGVSLVLLDMTMPGMTCEDTLDAIRAAAPQLPVILSSGYSESEALQRFRAYALAGFLQKPYTADTLAHRVATALSRVNQSRG
jgi:two-component system, cell cycle sensor histidine kinase and response regulator CckA